MRLGGWRGLRSTGSILGGRVGAEGDGVQKGWRRVGLGWVGKVFFLVECDLFMQIPI